MKKKVTSTDVARLAKVSQAAVSMILNGNNSISFSSETKERVIAAAKELNYCMHKIERLSGSANAKVIVVICPLFANPYYAMVVQSIQESAMGMDYSVFICNTLRSAKIETTYLDMLEQSPISGVIYVGSPYSPKRLEQLSKVKPLVIVGDKSDQMDIDIIELNSIKTGMIAAEHLLTLGHRRVAFLSTPLASHQIARLRRLEGVRKKFSEYGLEGGLILKAADSALDNQIPRSSTEYTSGYDLTMELINECADVTGIICINDMMALGATDALIDRKKRIPEDISVMGCDNTIFANLRNISLTTIDHFVDIKGNDAFNVLLQKMDATSAAQPTAKPSSIMRLEYEPKLIVRRSTGECRRTPKRP
ncbi:MAG: LacI family DNA-binding transcriptional regulator [Angelakisella sp.]